jgi:CHAD domain-containing protein
MNVDVQAAIKSLHKLHKELKDFPVQPTPDEVHEFRTHTRRLQAIVHTFSSESDHRAQRLLKLTKPVRRAAGKVRDMDVFIAKVHQIRDDSAGTGLGRLVEHIAVRRDKYLDRLHKVIAHHRKEILRALEEYARSLGSSNEVVSPAAPEILASELDHWPKLNANNLHEFRIRAKELRYMLQLVPDVQQPRMDALGEVKDLAGEWHDWLELGSLAREILDAAEDRQILKQIDAITRDKLRAGLAAANRLRSPRPSLSKAA